MRLLLALSFRRCSVAENEALVAWFGTGAREDAEWAVARQGPSLADVEARLSAVPSPFLDANVDVVALARDAGIVDPLRCASHAGAIEVRRGAALGVWLIASEEFVAPLVPSLSAGKAARMIDALALRLAPASDPLTWLAEGERREEAARCALLWCGYLPAGENPATARSLWQGLDSLSRNAALAKVQEEEQHRQAIAKKLVEARSREASARYSRE